MKQTLLIFLLNLVMVYSYGQKQSTDHYLNANISIGNSLIESNPYDRNYQLQVDYDLIKRLNVGVYYGFNRYENNQYSSYTGDDVSIKFKKHKVGAALQLTFVSFKFASNNTDKHYGIYLKGSLDHINEKEDYTNWIIASNKENYWSKQLSLGVNIPVVKRLGVMGECRFINAYDGYVYWDEINWRAGVTYRIFKFR